MEMMLEQLGIVLTFIQWFLGMIILSSISGLLWVVFKRGSS